MKTLNLPATISLPEAADLGPAMRALNERQRAFVFALFALGSRDPVEAARAAGYPDSGKSGIRVQAHRLAHNEKVQAAISEWQKKASRALIPFAAMNLVKIAGDPQHKDAAKVNLALMSMGGHGPVTESKVTHEVVLTRQEKIDQIKDFAKALGRDPEEFLGMVVDAEFEEVPEPAPEPEKDPWADVEY